MSQSLLQTRFIKIEFDEVADIKLNYPSIQQMLVYGNLMPTFGMKLNGYVVTY